MHVTMICSDKTTIIKHHVLKHHVRELPTNTVLLRATPAHWHRYVFVCLCSVGVCWAVNIECPVPHHFMHARIRCGRCRQPTERGVHRPPPPDEVATLTPLTSDGYEYIYIYIYIYLFIYLFIYTYTYTCIHVYMYTCIHIYKHICTYTYEYIHTHTNNHISEDA